METKILVPIVYNVYSERKAFLYTVKAYYCEDINGISINEDEELSKFQSLVKELLSKPSHIAVYIDPIDASEPLNEFDANNLSSITLGIFLAIEHHIYKKAFSENCDYVIATGDIAGQFLEPIGNEDKKLEAVRRFFEKEENKSKMAKFIYVKNSETLNSGLNAYRNIEIVRVNGSTKYADFMGKVFSKTGDSFEYFTNYVDKNGLPFGIKRISVAEVAERESSYRFTYSNNQLIKVEHINAKGWPLEGEETAEDPAVQIISYPDSNTIKIQCKTQTGKTKYIKELKKYHENFNRINFLSPDESYGYYLGKNALDFAYMSPSDVASKAQIRGYLLERNEAGYITREKFVRFQNSQEYQADKNGIYGHEYDVHENGLPYAEFYIGKDNERIEADGTGGVLYSYDKNWFVIEERFILLDGNPANNHQGFGKVKFQHDKYGNITKIVLLDKDNNKLLFNTLKYKKGLLVENIFFDKNGKEYMSNENFAKEIFEYTEQGYVSRRSTFDEKNRPILARSESENGSIYASAEFLRNEKGLITEERYYDTDGFPYPGAYGNGTEVIKYTYDAEGNNTGEIYCDAKGIMEEDPTGTAKIECMHDEYGRTTKLLYYGKNNLLKTNKSGFAIAKIEYDEETGNAKAVSFFDEKEKPVIASVFGYHAIKRTCNARGLITKEELYNEKEQPMNGVFAYEYIYDGHGNLTETKTIHKEDLLEDDK